MTAEPGDQSAAAGRGRMRASHADRELVIGMLKAAFVQGRLTKDEFDLRVGQTFASRTYAELATVAADIPAGLTGAQPLRKPARAQAQPTVNSEVKTGVRVSIAATMLAALMWAAAISADNITVFLVALGATASAFVASFLTGTRMLGSWLTSAPAASAARPGARR